MKSHFTFWLVITIGFFTTGFSACNFQDRKPEKAEIKWDTLEVTASAYNSLEYQTGSGNAKITAWGDTLKPDSKAIAVSRDLIQQGLTHNTPVRIEGFDGIFFVKDKMHYRWKNKIDIYMGEDVGKAKQWGRKKVRIFVPSAEQDENVEEIELQ